MDELTLDGKVYVSSKRAAKITGYAKDYIGQLCREGRVNARLVGRSWYVLEDSIREHRFGSGNTSEKLEKPQEDEKKTSVDTWEAPRYQNVEAAALPPLMPRDASKEETLRAVSDMQEAWKEWFAAQNERPTPAAEEGEVDPAPVIKVPELEEVEEAQSDITNEYKAEEAELPQAALIEEKVHIDRVQPIVHQEVKPESRLHDIRPVERGIMVEEAPIEPTEHVIDLGARMRKPQRARKAPRVAREWVQGSRFTMQASLIAVAGIAVAIAVIGTGFGDALLNVRASDGGVHSEIVNFLRGNTLLENNK